MSTHKMSYSKVYRTWIAMLNRCRNHKDANYKNYGGRGIFVCERWFKFENFYEDMGDLPFYEAQIDRIDNEKGYFKENCQWSTPKENSRNRRSSKFYETHLGVMTQQELIEKIGWSKNQFRWFITRYGIQWILERFKNNDLPKKTNISIDREDIVGKKIGKWNVKVFLSYTKKTGHLYLCECECGTENIIQRNNIIRSKSKQCRVCSAKNQWYKRLGR